MTNLPAHEDQLAEMAIPERILHRVAVILDGAHQLAVLHALAAIACGSRDLDRLLHRALDRLLELLRCDAGAIYVREDADSADLLSLHLRHQQGVPSSLVERIGRVPMGEGFIGEIAAHGEPRHTDLAALASSPLGLLLQRAGFRALMGIPLSASEGVVGVLVLASRERLPSVTSEFLAAIGRLLGAAVDAAREHQRLEEHIESERRRADRWHGVHQIAAVLDTSPPSSATLGEVCRRIHEIFDVPTVSLFLLDEPARELVLVATYSRYARPRPVGSRHPLSVGMLGWVARQGEMLLANDVMTEPRFVRAHAETQAELDLPVRQGGRTWGVLSLESDHPHAFAAEDVAALQALAHQIAMRLHAARRLEEMEHALSHLEESARAHRAALDALDVGLAIVREGRIRYANRRMAALTGYTVEEMIALPDLRSLLPEEDRDRVLAACRASGDRASQISSVPNARDPDRIPCRVLRRDGRAISAEMILLSREHEGGPTVCLIVRESDELLHRRIHAEKLAALEQVVSGIAHELNNPLTSVLGYAELLLVHEPLSETARHDLQTIVEQAQRAKRVVQNLLTFARFYRPEKSTVDVNEAIGAALETYQAHHPSSPLRVTTDLEPNLPPIRADRNLLHQVFTNIIRNAEYAVTQARGHGTLRVQTRMRSHANPPRQVIEIRFTDDGPGIPAAHLSRIFDPFFTTKPPGVGTGLGLSICYGIIKEHGGEIYALSEEGRGATFVIELPVMGSLEAKESRAADRLSS